jgi:SUN domain-containing protein 1/2
MQIKDASHDPSVHQASFMKAVQAAFADSSNRRTLARYTYDIHTARSVQSFASNDIAGLEPIDVVQLRVFNNWGNDRYTCLYRFRVHGETV